MPSTNSENQTQFSVEEPFFEDPNSLPSKEVAAKTHVPLLKRRKTIIAILIGAMFLSIGILFGYSQYVAWQRKLREPTEVVVPTPVPLSPSALTNEVQQLKDALKQADPVRQELLFPQIDMQLRMEERPR